MTKPTRKANTTTTPVRVAVAGATGLVGRSLLTQLLAEPRFKPVTALVRSASARLPAGPVTPLVVDFAQLGTASGVALPSIDWAFCCLGTTIKVAGSQSGFKAVDLDAVLAFARAAQAAGARRLGVVSALGADAKSGVFYNRIKGEAEQALSALGFDSLVLARPSLLLGNRAALGQPVRRGEALAQAITPAIGWLVPTRWRPIQAEVVAQALLLAVSQGQPGVQTLESDALAAFAQRAS
jgi:uncharacterized protein YbjT (DUF2867 family)